MISKQFNEAKLPSFFVVIIVLIGMSIGLYLFLYFIKPNFVTSLEQIIFLIYLLSYLSVWVVYFLSKSGPKIFRVATLRRLLSIESKHWDNYALTDELTDSNQEIEA